MSTPGGAVPMPQESPGLRARLAGVFWLMAFVTDAGGKFAPDRWVLPSELIATACLLAATVLVYQLLKPVNRKLSLLAAFFGLVGCAIGASNSLFHLGAQASIIDFLFFGLHCLLIGYLVLRSTFLPRTVGALMAFGGLGWMTFSLVTLLSGPLAQSLSPYFVAPGILGEVTLAMWLLVRGVNVQRWKEQAGAARDAREGA
jgi:hypothetical protein